MTQRFVLAAAVLLVSSCSGIRAVQLRPPVSAPMDLVSGYGVEKISGNPERARQIAYRKAMDDLMTRSGPVDGIPNQPILQEIFRQRAPRLFQPAFERTGNDHGFIWVLVATSNEDLERGWQQFVAWRAERIDQAQKLFEQAKGGSERPRLLKTALSVLDDAGVADDVSFDYQQIQSTLAAELVRAAQLEKFEKEFRALTDNGQLAAAETILEEAQRVGLDPPAYQRCISELSGRRAQAMQLIGIGDELLHNERFKEARVRYEQARKIDHDNSLVAGKIAMADQFAREARARAIRETVGFVLPIAVKTIGDYFEFKREEEIRKREEAEREAAEARRREEQQEQERSGRRPRRR